MMNLEKIARMAGVSRATVSRVINNQPYVSERVRERVWEVIEREGFQPNASARALARQRTEIIAVIGPEGLGSVFAQPYFGILLEGISSTISNSSYVMTLWAGSTPQETERMNRRILGYRLMDGAMLMSAIDDDPLPRALADRKVPMVVMGRSNLPDVSTVDTDNFAGARHATEHLIRLGRTRIVHVAGRMDIQAGRERLQGYRTALEASRLGFDPELVVYGDLNEPSGYYAARKIAALEADAVFAASDLMAFGVMRGLTEMGITVPDQVALVGFDDLPSAATHKPALSTVRQPIREMGKTAAQMLIDIIDGRITPPQRVVFPAELIIRETCGMW